MCAHTHMHTALGPLAVSGHIFDCYTLGGATGIYWVEARLLRNISQCTGQPLPNKSLSSLKCVEC